MLHRVPAGGEGLPSAAFHLAQRSFDSLSVNFIGDFFVACRFQHLRQVIANLLDAPADGVTVYGRVHTEQLVLSLRTVDITLFDVEAVESKQRGVFSAGLTLHQDYRSLI